MGIKRTTTAVAALAIGAAVMGRVWAVPIPLPPGGSVPLTPGVVGGVLLDNMTDSFSNVLYSGEVESWVYDDPAWPAGLTFAYQVRLDPNVAGSALEDVARFSTFPWSGFFTAVEQDPAFGEPGLTADRDAFPGSTVAFNWPAGFFEGEDSAQLIVRSDANRWTVGIGGVINGQTSNVDVFVPDRAVPDGGASAVLLGLSLLGLEGFRRLRR